MKDTGSRRRGKLRKLKLGDERDTGSRRRGIQLAGNVRYR
jgi:hypothetical protein